jgi:tetratricopeptide (TPR) repeat protein
VRFLGFFVVVFVALLVLREVPVVGSVFRIPLLGFYLAALLVSALAARLGSELVASRKRRDELRRLGEVDTPHQRGKLGRMLELSGKPAQAIAPLEEAAAAEPEEAEWWYRLGRARLALRRVGEALSALQRARELDEEHGYGALLLTLAEASRRSGDGDGALEALGRFEGLYGPTPESAFRRGQVLSGLTRKAEARAAYSEVAGLAAGQPKYQRADGRRWALKAAFARLFA